MKYAFIQDRMAEADNPYRLSAFCRVLEVSRSGFYEWVERSIQPDPDAVALEVGVILFCVLFVALGSGRTLAETACCPLLSCRDSASNCLPIRSSVSVQPRHLDETKLSV